MRTNRRSMSILCKTTARRGGLFTYYVNHSRHAQVLDSKSSVDWERLGEWPTDPDPLAIAPILTSHAQPLGRMAGAQFLVMNLPITSSLDWNSFGAGLQVLGGSLFTSSITIYLEFFRPEHVHDKQRHRIPSQQTQACKWSHGVN